MHFLLNVYSDSQQSALKHLKDTKINLNNVIIITDDFNICNSDWDLSYPHHSIHADTLHKISDSLSLELSIPINPIPIWYTDNAQDLNSVIDLMFLRPNHRGFNNH